MKLKCFYLFVRFANELMTNIKGSGILHNHHQQFCRASRRTSPPRCLTKTFCLVPPLWLLSTAFTHFGSFNDMLTSCIFPFGLPKSNSFLFSVYRNDATSGVAKVLRDLKEVLGEPESCSTNLADKLTYVGLRGNNYSPRGWVGGWGGGGGGRWRGGKREFFSPAPHHHPASQGNLQT